MAERYRVTATVQSQNRAHLGTDPKEALRIPLFYHVAAGLYTKIARRLPIGRLLSLPAESSPDSGKERLAADAANQIVGDQGILLQAHREQRLRVDAVRDPQ